MSRTPKPTGSPRDVGFGFFMIVRAWADDRPRPVQPPGGGKE